MLPPPLLKNNPLIILQVYLKIPLENSNLLNSHSKFALSLAPAKKATSIPWTPPPPRGKCFYRLIQCCKLVTRHRQTPGNIYTNDQNIFSAF